MAIDLSGGDEPARPGSRILVDCGGPVGKLVVAGVPLWKRAIYGACRAGFDEILIVTDGAPEALETELRGDARLDGRRWGVVAACDGWAERVAASGGRWVVLSADWVVDAELLKQLSATSGAAVAVASSGLLSADASELARWASAGWRPTSAPPASVGLAPPSGGVCARVGGPGDVGRAEEALIRSLSRNANNFFAEHVDRAMSRALSKRLAPLPITPNQITFFSIALGIFGALLLLVPSYAFGALGSFLFFASTVIDGCDGEIARLKFQESRLGARIDVIGDNVVHAFLFPCVALRFYFADPHGPFLVLGAVSLAGVVVTWIVVYALILRADASARLTRIFELFANREFAYLFLFLGLVGRLQWFVWMMAFGLWVFPATLLAVRLWEKFAGRLAAAPS